MAYDSTKPIPRENSNLLGVKRPRKAVSMLEMNIDKPLPDISTPQAAEWHHASSSDLTTTRPKTSYAESTSHASTSKFTLESRSNPLLLDSPEDEIAEPSTDASTRRPRKRPSFLGLRLPSSGPSNSENDPEGKRPSARKSRSFSAEPKVSPTLSRRKTQETLGTSSIEQQATVQGDSQAEGLGIDLPVSAPDKGKRRATLEPPTTSKKRSASTERQKDAAPRKGPFSSFFRKSSAQSSAPAPTTSATTAEAEAQIPQLPKLGSFGGSLSMDRAFSEGSSSLAGKRNRSGSISKWGFSLPSSSSQNSQDGFGASRDSTTRLRRSLSSSSAAGSVVSKVPTTDRPPSPITSTHSPQTSSPLHSPLLGSFQSGSRSPTPQLGSSTTTAKSLTFALPQPEEKPSAQASAPTPRMRRRSSVSSASSTLTASVLHAVNPFSSSKTSAKESPEETRPPSRSSILSHPRGSEPTLMDLANEDLAQTEMESIADPIPITDPEHGTKRARSASSPLAIASDAINGFFFGRNRSPSSTSLFASSPIKSSPVSSLSVPRPPYARSLSNRSAASSTTSVNEFGTSGDGTVSTTPTSIDPDEMGKQMERSFSAVSSPSKPTLPPIEEDDTPQSYLSKLLDICSRATIATMLSSRKEPFYADALGIYMESFDFDRLPIDIALRKLLSELYLPPETQQIDRVMEAFAQRYHGQNPNVFSNSDQAYVLSFSLIMLHTDHFNKNNKNRMTKADYLRNTKIEGVSDLLLSYLYDNITYSTFIFVEDGMDVNGQRLITKQQSLATPSKAKAKLNPYALIAQGSIKDLQVDVELYVPKKNPFSYCGTTPFFNQTDLHRALLDAPSMDIPRQTASTITSAPVGLADQLVSATTLPGISWSPMIVFPAEREEAASIKVTKVGPLSRQNDKGRWKPFSVILTGSQLLLFKSSIWAESLSRQIDAGDKTLKMPYIDFKPDEIISLDSKVALYDWTYISTHHTFSLASMSGSSQLYQTSDASETNDWIAAINYAAAFKTAGVRMRTESGGLRRPSRPPTSRANSFHGTEESRDIVPPSTGEASEAANSKTDRLVYSSAGQVIGRAAGADANWEDETVFEQFSQANFAHMGVSDRKATRSQIIRLKIADLETKIATDKAALQSSLKQAEALSLLTPFRSATRKYIQEAIVSIGHTVRQVRKQIAARVVSREVLARDLLAEERESSRMSQRPRLTSQRSDFGVFNQG